MQCEYCNKEFPDKELGKFKDKRVCFTCATNNGIPADFESFLEDTALARDGEDPLLTGDKPKKKDKGNLLVSFLVSAIFAVATFNLYMFFPPLRVGYLFIAEGILSGLCVRLLQKGRGGNHQNIVAVMIMLSFIIPQLQLMKSSEMFDIFTIVKDSIFLMAGVFISYMLLVEITPSPKKEKKQGQNGVSAH